MVVMRLPWKIPNLWDWLTGLFNKETEKKTIWTNVLTEEQPEELVDRISYYITLGTQMIVSKFTESAGMAAFLMEESAQAVGMGAYLLYTSKDWETLATYMDAYGIMINGMSKGVIGLANLNPIVGGTCLIYFEAATKNYEGLNAAVRKQVENEAGKLGIKYTTEQTTKEIIDLINVANKEKAAQAIIEANKYGTLVLKSSPTGAQIYIDEKATELETPETFTKLEVGSHDVAVAKYSSKRNVWDVYACTIKIEAGKKKEVTLHIPEAVSDDDTNPEGKEETSTPKLPNFIKSEVKGDYAIDGDTFVTKTGEHIRLLGIDAPELGRPYADLAKELLNSKTADKTVELSIQTHLPIDAYGRTLALCYYRDENLSVTLVSTGLARAFIADDARYDPTRILEAERIAKERRIGIWSEIP